MQYLAPVLLAGKGEFKRGEGDNLSPLWGLGIRRGLARFLECVLVPTLTHPTEVRPLYQHLKRGGEGYHPREGNNISPLGVGFESLKQCDLSPLSTLGGGVKEMKRGEAFLGGWVWEEREPLKRRV